MPLLRRYPTAWLTAGWDGWRHRGAYDGVRRYVMFVGHPRTGHSLVGALLDAHPSALVAHELDALKYVEAGFDRRRLYALLARTEQRRVASGHRSSTGYQYAVPGQWQGRHQRLEVIGDKKGGRSTLRLGDDPGLLDRLRACVGVDVAVVQVVRNPFDVIATMHRRAPRRSLEDCAALFFRLSDIVEQVSKRVPGELFHELHHEQFVRDPRGVLAGLCSFVGLEAPTDYLDACASIVFEAPRHTRAGAAWTPELTELVAARSAGYRSLAGYRFGEVVSEEGAR
jgi:hypothetical protein